MDDFEFLVEYDAKMMVRYLMEDFGVECDEAMRRVYSSETFHRVQDQRFGLYSQSPALLYELLMTEERTGHFIYGDYN